MAPQRDQAAAAEAAPASSQLAGAPPPGAEDLHARVPLRWPFSSRAQQERAQRAAAAREESGSEIELSEESEDDESNSIGRRVNDDEVDTKPGESEKSSTATLQAGQPSRENDVPDEAVTPITDKWVAERRAKMFVLGAAAPVESRLPDTAAAPTKQLIALVSAHVQDLPKADIDALSTSFGNFDRVVAGGWLVADALGSPLLDRGMAYTLGLKVKYLAGKVKKDLAKIKQDAQRDAGRLAPDDPKRLELMARAEKGSETLMAEVVELPLVTSTGGAAARASGSRKRAREEEEEELSHEERIEVLNDGLLFCQKWMKEAEAELARASQAADAKGRVAERMACRLEDALAKKKPNIMMFMNPWQDAKERRLMAVIDQGLAANYLLTAQLAASDAQKEIYQAQWEHARAS